MGKLSGLVALLLSGCAGTVWQSRQVDRVLLQRDTDAQIDASLEGALSLFVRLYQIAVRPALSPNCQFEPSCSNYGLLSFRRYGPILGTLKTCDRLTRCHIGAQGQYTPIDVLAPCYECGEDHPAVKLYDPPDSDARHLRPRAAPAGPLPIGFKQAAEALQKKLPAAPEEQQRLFAFGFELLLQKDLVRAVTEFRRFLSYYPAAPLAHEAALLERVALIFQKDYAAVIDMPEGPEYGDLETYLHAFALYKLRRPADCRLRLRTLPASWSGEAQFLSFAALLDDGRYAEALQEWTAAPERLRQFDSIPNRSPVAAGVLSALLPGVGQTYAGRFGDGLSSFLVTGALGAATYEAFSERLDVIGVLTGSLALLFYSAGIYGATYSAERFNDSAHRRFRQQVFDASPASELFRRIESEPREGLSGMR